MIHFIIAWVLSSIVSRKQNLSVHSLLIIMMVEFTMVLFCGQVNEKKARLCYGAIQIVIMIIIIMQATKEQTEIQANGFLNKTWLITKRC